MIEEELGAQIAMERLGQIEPTATGIHDVAFLVADMVDAAYLLEPRAQPRSDTTTGMVRPSGDLAAHRVLIDACLRLRVPFAWHGPGTLLIPSSSVGVVIADVTSQGYAVTGIEGFDVDPRIHPRLDLIIDNTAGHPYRVPEIEVPAWGDVVWVDVSLARQPAVTLAHALRGSRPNPRPPVVNAPGEDEHAEEQ